MMFTRIYILTCPQLKLRYKIGQSRDVFNRIGQIADELAQEMQQTVTINKEMSVPVLFPDFVERLMHRAFSAYRAKVPYHAGYTEWFRPRNFWTAVVYFLFLVGFGHLHVITPDLTVMRILIAVVFYYTPYPLDSMLLLGLVFLAQFALVAAALWAGWLGLITLLNFL